MAFTRKMLKALGIEEEKIDQIMDAHTEVTDALKADRDRYKVDAEKLPSVEKELNDYKAKPEDGYKEKYEALTAEIEQKETKAAKETAYREMLKNIGVKEKYIDTIVRADASVIDGLTVADGKIKDADTVKEAAKKSWSEFVATTEHRHDNPSNPPANGGGGGKTKEQILAIKDDDERRKAMYDNAELFGLNVKK